MGIHPKTTVTRHHSFCAAHRLYKYDGPCKNVHGHNYEVEITIQGTDDQLNESNMVVDFKEVKQLLCSWIDENWDHAFIHFSGDEIAYKIVDAWSDGKSFVIGTNPTAEAMADFLLEIFNIRLKRSEKPYQVCKIKLWETKNCYAEVTL